MFDSTAGAGIGNVRVDIGLNNTRPLFYIQFDHKPSEGLTRGQLLIRLELIPVWTSNYIHCEV